MKARSKVSMICGSVLSVLCFSLLAIPVSAEEIAGYHEKVMTESEAEDTWYSVGRGVYLSYGTAKIRREGKAKVTISGSTNAHSKVDELRLTLYLDESPNNESYGTIGSYHYSEKDDVSVVGGEVNLQVTSGYYYSVRGVHSVFEGETRETTDTCTDAITAL